MAKVLMKGNEAIAEAAIRAGCKAFFGYPITPQSEIPEYFSRELPLVGGTFIQAESEIAAISMVMGASASGARVMTSTSGPGYCLKLETIAAMTLTRLPAVITVVMRNGPAFGNMKAAQEDYRMNGNGGYKVVMLAPSTVQEAAEMTFEAFDIADHYRNPVVILADGMIGQMMGSVDFDLIPPSNFREIKKEWALHGRGSRNGVPIFHYVPEGRSHYQEKHYAETVLYPSIEKNEVRYEASGLEDADIIITAYGTAARMSRLAINQFSEQNPNINIGYVRPKSLWPFPYDVYQKIGAKCRLVICPEINIIGQMIDDVKIAVQGRFPVIHVGDSQDEGLRPNNILNMLNEKSKEYGL